MGTNIITYLKEKFGILEVTPVAHIHTEEPVTGIALTAGNPVKLDLELIAKHIIANGGWVYDNTLSRFTWIGDINFVPIFAGTGSVEMTIGTSAKLTFILRVNGTEDVLTTPSTFDTLSKIQQLAAVDLVQNGQPYITTNDYVEVWAVSDTNATFSIESFQIALLGR